MTSDNITVIMKPTNQCNLRCKYCYHADNGYDKEKMTDQVLEKAIAVTAPFFKRVEYNWHGGEPLIMGLDFYERVLYYQKKYRQGPEHHIINTMQTNGTLITQETAEFIKKYGFGIGLSFDGPFNDQTRGKTDYTLNAYDLLKQIDKRHGTISVIGAHNIHNLIDIYKYFNEKNISFKFSPMFDSGEAKNHCELLLTDPAEYADKICELFDYWMNDVDGNIEVRPFASYVSSYFTHHMRSCTKGNCMYHMASIYHDGKVYPCGRSYPEEYCLGNISEVKDIRNLFREKVYQQIVNKRCIRENECRRQCNIFSYCNAGCNNDCILSGDITKRNMFQCISHQIILKHIHKRVKEVIETKRTINNYMMRIIKRYSR